MTCCPSITICEWTSLSAFTARIHGALGQVGVQFIIHSPIELHSSTLTVVIVLYTHG